MADERVELGFDGPWYLGRYPDVAIAILKGAARDAWDHFVKIGRDEGREAFAFDEAWYLDSNADVRAAYRQRAIQSPKIHYLQHGRNEDRFPVAAGRATRVIAYGSFGSNNVGDEAILEGIKRFYPDCIQVYHNKIRTGEGYLATQLLGSTPFFRSTDYLILGGGGLLYDRGTVTLMIRLARAAREQGAIVDIARMGCEAAQDDYAKEIVELFEMARRVTLRSTLSQAIMEKLTGKTYAVEPDFAFNLAEEARRMPRRGNDIPTIGIATASSSRGDIEALAAVIKKYTRAGTREKVRFVHIPHSRSYFEIGNNDCVTSNELWTLCHMHQAEDESLLQLLDYDPEPLSVLQTYRNLDAVMSSRYHGLIFGQITDTPTLAIGGDLIKLRSLIEDHGAESMLVARNMGELEQTLAALLPVVRERSASR